jgi:hypothetical protein
MTGSHDEPTARPGTPGTQPPSPRPLNVARLWAGGVATAVVATLIALVGVLVVRVVLRIAGYTLSGASGFGGSATVALCVAAAAGALVATGLAHVLIITTPRPLTYLSYQCGRATNASCRGSPPPGSRHACGGSHTTSIWAADRPPSHRPHARTA